jgi:hypothetical protein
LERSPPARILRLRQRVRCSAMLSKSIPVVQGACYTCDCGVVMGVGVIVGVAVGGIEVGVAGMGVAVGGLVRTGAEVGARFGVEVDGAAGSALVGRIKGASVGVVGAGDWIGAENAGNGSVKLRPMAKASATFSANSPSGSASPRCLPSEGLDPPVGGGVFALIGASPFHPGFFPAPLSDTPARSTATGDTPGRQRRYKSGT